MKKVILSTVFGLLSFISFAQTGAQSSKKETVSKYIAAPDKKFMIEFSAGEFDFLMNCAQYGFQPYIKTTTTPMNQTDALQQSYTQVLKDKLEQFRKQYVSDSLQHANPKH